MSKDSEPKKDLNTEKKDQNEKKPELKQVSIYKLFRYASRTDSILLFLATLSTFGVGASTPVLVYILGNATDQFANTYSDSITDRLLKTLIQFASAGLASMLVFFISRLLFKILSYNIGKILRIKYFTALLTHELAWHDQNKINEISSRVEVECSTIVAVLEEKIFILFMGTSSIFSGFIIGFYRGWQLSLVCMASLPFLGISYIFAFKNFFAEMMSKMTHYPKAGALVNQALTAIKTVLALGGEDREVKQYLDTLDKNQIIIKKTAFWSGFSFGINFGINFWVYSLAYYVGSKFVYDKVNNSRGEPYSSGDIMTIYFSVVVGGMSLSMLAPIIKEIMGAKVTAGKIYDIIDRASVINPLSSSGIKPDKFNARIVFKDVEFSYPSKKEVKVLKGVNLTFEPGQRTALVGESGCGKSTCVQLIERFYDVENGSILLDNHNIKDLNVAWLRQNISYVGQEPVLFAGTVKENLLYGKQDANDEEMFKALKQANAYEFVMNLDKKLDTYLGDGGAQLSGGQKQRLAIARAILKDSKIILLDEATSALDRKNEREIQETLDKISEGRTTIIIAHRLSTIKNADKIYLIESGNVAEEGTHDTLIELNNKYYHLQKAQLTNEDENANTVGISPADVDIPLNLPELKNNKSSSVAPNYVPVQVKTEEITSESEKKKKNKRYSLSQTFGRLYRSYGKNNKLAIFIALSASIGQGAVAPINALIFSNFIFMFLTADASDYLSKTGFLAIMYLILGVFVFLVTLAQRSCYGIIGENVSIQLRKDVYRKFLRMPIKWHEKPENSAGILSTSLAKDAENLSNVISNMIGYILQAMSSLIGGLILGFIGSWKLTLISLAIIPFILTVSRMHARIARRKEEEKDKLTKSSRIIIESLSNTRTIASLGAETMTINKYEFVLKDAGKLGKKLAGIQGFLLGLNQLIIYLYFGILQTLGGYFVEHDNLTALNVFMSLYGILFAIMDIGNALNFLPDIGQAMSAAEKMFGYLDTVSEIDIDDPTPKYKGEIKGKIEFRNVKFKYPSRERHVFEKLSFKIDAGQKIAFVGSSGCGKSTVLQLLMRFYDVDEGNIFLDGKDVREYDLKFLRSIFGVVSQEPVLFDGTIEYNIKYTKENATDEEMKEAAEKANALGFIEKNEFDSKDKDDADLGKGFQRMVGAKGSQISGGQKQRIAIARAIIKNPKIYLFDEATSALDANSEAVVQTSLNEISKSTTSLTVAHRFSTIRGSDQIYVFKEGEIIERGTYQELDQKHGYFYNLARGLE